MSNTGGAGVGMAEAEAVASTGAGTGTGDGINVEDGRGKDDSRDDCSKGEPHQEGSDEDANVGLGNIQGWQ